MRKLLSVVLLAALALTAGCDDRGEKGKNKDKDVPKPAKGEPAA